MAEQKKIDVVIPAYKPGEKFQKLIKMLQKQTYPIHEILIMNTEKKHIFRRPPLRGFRMCEWSI